MQNIGIKTDRFYMGVYVFRSRRGEFVKVGHYVGWNAWSRIASRHGQRGFAGCICPPEIDGKVAVGDVELVAWFPMLARDAEGHIKTAFAAERAAGEWYAASAQTRIVDSLASYNVSPKQVADMAMRLGCDGRAKERKALVAATVVAFEAYAAAPRRATRPRPKPAAAAAGAAAPPAVRHSFPGFRGKVLVHGRDADRTGAHADFVAVSADGTAVYHNRLDLCDLAAALAGHRL